MSIFKWLHDQFFPSKSELEYYQEWGRNSVDAMKNRPVKDEYSKALEEMLASTEGLYSSSNPFFTPSTIQEYIDQKNGKSKYTYADYKSEQDRKRLEEKLDEQIRLQKEILEKLNRQL